MGFEFFKRKPKSPEQSKDDMQRRAAIGLAAVGAVGAVGAATEMHKENVDLQGSNLMGTVPASAPASAENPTLGMKSSDSPEPVVVPLPQEHVAEQVVVNPAEESVVINLAEKQVVVEHPET